MITTASELLAAIKGAGAGAVIVLSPGNYENVKISNENPSNVVVITSEDPENRAVFTGSFGISNSSNIILRNVVFDFSTSTDPYWAGRLARVNNITLDGVRVTSNGPDSPAGGFYALDTDHLTVINSTFDHIGSVALGAIRATALNISGNDFSYWEKSAVGIGQVQGLTFTKNTIHDGFPSPGTHPDGLQLFTVNSKIASSDLRINDNRMWAGTGRAYQAIFLGDETRQLPYYNVEIERNCLIGTMWDSIYLKSGAGNIRIINNTTFSYPLPDSESTKEPGHPITTNFKAEILVSIAPGSELTETGNSAQGYSDQNGKGIRVAPGNSLIGSRRPVAIAEVGRPASSQRRATSASSNEKCE